MESGNRLRRKKQIKTTKQTKQNHQSIAYAVCFSQVQSSSSSSLFLLIFSVCTLYLYCRVLRLSFNLRKIVFKGCLGSWINQLPKAKFLVLYVFVELSQPPVGLFSPITGWNGALLNCCSSKDRLTEHGSK